MNFKWNLSAWSYFFFQPHSTVWVTVGNWWSCKCPVLGLFLEGVTEKEEDNGFEYIKSMKEELFSNSWSSDWHSRCLINISWMNGNLLDFSLYTQSSVILYVCLLLPILSRILWALLVCELRYFSSSGKFSSVYYWLDYCHISIYSWYPSGTLIICILNHLVSTFRGSYLFPIISFSLHIGFEL